MNSKQDEILLILQEECAEVIQAICKIRRFGLETNVDQLRQEVGDVLCMLELAYQHDLLGNSLEELSDRIEYKKNKLKKYSKILD